MRLSLTSPLWTTSEEAAYRSVGAGVEKLEGEYEWLVRRYLRRCWCSREHMPLVTFVVKVVCRDEEDAWAWSSGMREDLPPHPKKHLNRYARRLTRMRKDFFAEMLIRSEV